MNFLFVASKFDYFYLAKKLFNDPVLQMPFSIGLEQIKYGKERKPVEFENFCRTLYFQNALNEGEKAVAIEKSMRQKN